MAMAFIVGMPLLRLWWYHVQTILCKGQTTNEDIRGEHRSLVIIVSFLGLYFMDSEIVMPVV